MTVGIEEDKNQLGDNEDLNRGHPQTTVESDNQSILNLISQTRYYEFSQKVPKCRGLNNQVVLALWKCGYYRLVDDNPNSFTITWDAAFAAQALAEGCPGLVAGNITVFANGSLPADIAYQLASKEQVSDFGNKYGYVVIEHPEKFIGVALNADFALSNIERGNFDFVLANKTHFEGLVFDDELAKRIISVGKVGELAQYLKEFQSLSRTVAEQIAISGNLRQVVLHPDSFVSMSFFDNDFAKLLKGQNVLVQLAKQISESDPKLLISRFRGLDTDIATELIKLNLGYVVYMYTGSFLPEVCSAEFARSLMSQGYHSTVKEFLQKFKDLEKRDAEDLIDRGYGESVLKNINKFSGLDYDLELARYLILKGYVALLNSNITLFHQLASLADITSTEGVKNELEDIAQALVSFRNNR